MTDTTPDVPTLRRLLAEATPGPWEHDGGWTVTAPPPDGWQGPYMVTSTERCRTDAALIVAAVNALPGILDRLEAAEGAVARVEALFNGGPDTPCRTTYREDWMLAPLTECVEVPMDDLRAALAEVTP